MKSMPIVLAIVAHAALTSGHEKEGVFLAGSAIISSMVLWVLDGTRWLEGKKGDQGPA